MLRARDGYKTTKIKRGNLIPRLNNKTQKDWLKACERLGVIVSTESGRGSHAAVYKDDCPPENSECCILTIKKNPHNQMQSSCFKKLLHYGIESKKYNEDDLWKALKIKI